MDKRRLVIVTFALMMGLFLAALEGTVVSTAMPTIVAQLGGLEIYSWVFSIYMLTSTTTIPLFGRLSDFYGRKPIYMLGVALFLLGSALSGQAWDMTSLIFFRALQGIGAGALMPMAFTIIGDIYTLEQRARMQGLFSGVWGVSSVVGPLVGGFFVDNVSWRWVFYVNIPFGLLAAVLLWLFLEEPVTERGKRQLDWLGAVMLTGSVLALLYALLQGGVVWAWSDPRILALLAFSFVLFWLFIRQESRVTDPLIPLNLYSDRLFATASLHGFLSGLAVFGTMSYIPLYVQGVVGTSATQAGASVTPMMLGWVSGSIASGYLLLRIGPRRIAIGGMTLMSIGAFLLTLMDAANARWLVLFSVLFMGLGMGVTVTAYLVAVQTRVARRRMGVATSALQFVRQIGGTLGVSLLGAVMAARLTQGLASLPGGEDINPQSLLDRSAGMTLPPAVAEGFQRLLADSLHPAFYVTLTAALLGLVVAFLTPRGTTQKLAAEGETASRAPESTEAIVPEPARK